MENGSEGSTLPIICVTNRKLCTAPFMEQLEKIVRSGITKIILREKDLSEMEYTQLAEKFVNLCQLYNVKGALHSYGNAALRAGAESLHLSVEGLRCWKKEHPEPLFKCLGASVHSAAEAEEAEMLGADYIIAGHVFPTECKKGIPGRGAGFLREVSSAVIMSGLMKARCPELLTASLQEAWNFE